MPVLSRRQAAGAPSARGLLLTLLGAPLVLPVRDVRELTAVSRRQSVKGAAAAAVAAHGPKLKADR